MEHIRDIHDPSLHLKTIQDELMGTIGQVLGKQAQTIVAAMRQMNDEYIKYETLLLDEEKDYDVTSPELLEIDKKYNLHRIQAQQSRRELMVHRQRVGFTVGNNKSVMEKFPIEEPLYQPQEDKEGNDDAEEEPRKKPKKLEINWIGGKL